MTFDDDAAYLVFKARDARFDGRLFVGVSSTGIYCRPVCRVRLPKRENCSFYTSAAQAEAAAFRPCLKCRPELAPGAQLAWTVMDASHTLARQAAHWLDQQGSEEPSIESLAARLGVSDRHLRRIFAKVHGVTPLQYVQTRRLLLAKQLLTDTDLPVSQVALASGFRSLRRFNAAFAESYRMSPSRLRGRAAAGHGAQASVEGAPVTVTLGHRLPYDRTHLLGFLGQRAIPGVETVDAARIRRSLRPGVVGEAAGWLEAEFFPETPTRPASVRLSFPPALAPFSRRLLSGVRRWLDLDADPSAIDQALATLPAHPGLRLPGCLDTFEMAVRAVLGQQVTVAGARTLARRLVARFGEPAATPWPEVDRFFPSPQRLAACSAGEIAEAGIIRSRAGAIIALAQGWDEIAHRIGDSVHTAEALIAHLCTLPGIGPWTAHYIAMRALGWPDAFPPKDVAVLKAMKALFGVDGARAAEQQSQAWRPWRSYAVLRLWHSLGPPPPSH